MTKKIYLEPTWRLHATWDHMANSPPADYEFVAAPSSQERLFKAISRWNVAYTTLKTIDSTIPAVLARSWIQKWRNPPANSVLTYAISHLVFRPEPWVVEVEYASLLAGGHPKHLGRFKGRVERLLASLQCKKILCWSEAGRRTILSGLDSQMFRHKVEIFRLAVPPKRFVKEKRDGKVKLIFVGSGKIAGKFEAKGGLEVLETFALLSQRYHNLELVIRSDIPAEVKSRYGGIENLRLMDKVLPWETLEQEYRTADIFLLPCHSTSPFAILDAMSYELPVVTIDAWANREFVEDGRTGLLVEPSNKLSYYYGKTCHPNYGTAEFEKAIREPDPEVVGEMARKVSLLIENPELRRKMGKAARQEVETGKFSISIRNEKLKRLFDEATAVGVATQKRGGSVK